MTQAQGTSPPPRDPCTPKWGGRCSECSVTRGQRRSQVAPSFARAGLRPSLRASLPGARLAVTGTANLSERSKIVFIKRFVWISLPFVNSAPDFVNSEPVPSPLENNLNPLKGPKVFQIL